MSTASFDAVAAVLLIPIGSAALLAMEEPVLEASNDMRIAPYRVNVRETPAPDVSRDGSGAPKK